MNLRLQLEIEMKEAFRRRQVAECWKQGAIATNMLRHGLWKRTKRIGAIETQALANRPNAMHGFKLLKIERNPTLAIFELRDGQYWDGIRVIRMGDGIAPKPDGFYVCELTGDGCMVQLPPDGNGSGVLGPYASAEEAEHETRKSMTKPAKIDEELAHEGQVQREV
jgi:hypothetical protein